MAAARADPARARPRGDRALVEAEGYGPNVYVDDELYVAEDTQGARAYAGFQHLDVHTVGDLLEWLDEPPTKLVCVGDPVELDGVEARHEGALRRPPVHLEVAAATSSSSPRPA